MRRAFTLMELLVVMALVTVLLGFMLPAIGRARAQEAETACEANLRKIGIALGMYAADNAAYTPALYALAKTERRDRPNGDMRLTAAFWKRGEAYGEVFDLASSLIGVQALGAPDLMIEIKCTARL